MSTVFPAAKDTLSNPSATDPQNAPSHSSQHANANDAIEAIETKVGVDGSADTGSLDYRVSTLEAGTLPDPGYVTVGEPGSGADYNDIQSALDAMTSGGLIRILGGTFTVTSGLLYKYSSTIIEGSYDSSVIQVDGTLVPTLLKANTTGLSRCGLKNIRLIQTNGSVAGTALDLSDMPIFDLQHVYVFNSDKVLVLNDTTNQTFYSSYRDLAGVQVNNGIWIESTNPVNDNLFENIRIACNANGIGLRMTQGQGNVFYNLNCEPNSSTGTKGISLGNAGTGVTDTTFVGAWIEGNGLGLEVNAAVLRSKFIGCNIGYNTSNISDASSSSNYFSCREQDSLKNDLTAVRSVLQNGSSTDAFIAYLNSSDATHRAFRAANDTNFAHSGDLFSGQFMNGSDSGHIFRAQNNGSGYNFLGENNAGTDTFTVDKNGNVTNAGTLAATGIVTPTGGVAAAGGFAVSARLMHTGSLPARISTDGTDTTPVVTETYIAEVFVPANVTLTGIAIFNGSAVAGSVAVALANSSGAVMASSNSTIAAGTDAYQRVAFTSTYAAKGPATYYALLQCNNTGNRFNSHTFGNFGASKKTGETFGTFTTVTPPTTFTTAQGPIASLY